MKELSTAVSCSTDRVIDKKHNWLITGKSGKWSRDDDNQY